VRIIAGAYKGRRLVAPRGETTRPTADQQQRVLAGLFQQRAVAQEIRDTELRQA